MTLWTPCIIYRGHSLNHFVNFENCILVFYIVRCLYVQFVIGSLHCVACTDQGEVYTWGDNDEGQLGDGTTTAIMKPRLIMALQVSLLCYC